MKKINQRSRAMVITVVLCTVLSSFAFPGAHSYQLFVDGKLVVDQYITRDTNIPKVMLNNDVINTQVIVKYSECGRTVTGRKLTLKDEQDKTLKEWTFDGATSGYKDPMTISVKDIVALKPGKGPIKLFYSSNDFKQGQIVAFLSIDKDIAAAMK